jgi:hypothetical protein
MQIQKNDLVKAVGRLSLLKYEKSQAMVEAALMEFLALICPSREALDWLVAELVNKIGEWPGTADVRGLLCTMYKPADGIHVDCKIPGYRWQDFEDRAIENAQKYKALEMGTQPILQQRIAEIAPKLLEARKL